MLAVHRRYVRAGCDVLSTNTWGLPSALCEDGPRLWDSAQPVHWMDIARRGLHLARQAVEEEGRGGDCAVAFSLNGDVDSPEGQETIRLLARPFQEEPPDLILLETLSLVGPSIYGTVESLLETGLPVWLSFRRCSQGVCGVYGQHWGGPEGDLFGRQLPVDPAEQVSSHRPMDYWGRGLLDHLVTMLPEALAEEEEVAYLMQLSILSQRRTSGLLARHGFEARVVDYSFFELGELFHKGRAHIKHVEEMTDAYHLRFGDQDVMVAYLLEVTRAGSTGRAQPPGAARRTR